MTDKKDRIARENIQDIFALTPLQEGMLFHYLKEPESDYYFEQLSLDIDGQVDLSLFRQTWERLTRDNEMLRTVFRWAEVKAPVQIVLKQAVPAIDFWEYNGRNSTVKAEDAEAWLETIKREDRERKFDLTKAPFRLTLCKLNSNRYAMIISHHHILYDGWSTGILLKEFLQTYHGLSKGKSSGIAFEEKSSLKGRFKDYVKWLSNQDTDAQKEFWEEYLQGFDSRTRLPGMAGVDGSCQACHEGVPVTREHSFYLPSGLKEEVENVARSNKVTLAAVMYSAWGLVMQKYGNTRDVVFGTTISGRHVGLKGVEEMVGLFINTIPLRLKTQPEETTAQLTANVQHGLQKRETHETTPIVDIKQHCRFDSQEELFDCIMVIDNYPLDSLLTDRGDNIAFRAYSAFEMSNYLLTIGVDLFDKCRVLFSYNEQMFHEETVARLAGHFVTILQGMVTNPQKPVASLELLTREEKEDILYRINPKVHDKRTPYPSNKTIHQLVEEQVERTPNAEAMVFGDLRLDYKTVNSKANQLARELRKRGVGVESVVGIIGEYSVEVPIGMFAVLKAGGAYSPMIPTYPASRVEYILKDSNTSLLLTQIDFDHHYAEVDFSGEVIDIRLETSDHQSNPLYRGEESNLEPLPGANASNLAFVLYTSGSTGKPKGVTVEHRNVNNLLTWMIDMYRLVPGTRVLQLTDYTFDPHVEDIFGTWQCGGTLHVVTHEQLIDIEPLRQYIQDEDLHMVNCVPAYLNDLLAGKEKLDSLRVVISGGDRLDDPLKDQLLKDGYPLTNHYGLIETTVDVLISRNSHELPASLGWPMANNGAYILDQDLNLMPLGITGEIGITGDNVVRGYLNRPELTYERFIPNRFLPDEHLRIMRTGDLGRADDQGNIMILDRMDNQVKIRGYRIELGEIENRLIKHDKVAEAAVVVREAVGGGDSGEERGSKYLCGYVALRGNRLILQDKETGEEKVCRIVTTAQEPELEERIEALHTDAWPAFFVGDAVSMKYWKRLYRDFAHLQFGILDEEGNLLAAGNTIPLCWSSSASPLPNGWDDVLERGFSSDVDNSPSKTLCGLAAVVNTKFKNRGLSYEIIKIMAAMANECSYEEIIIPVRMVQKEQFPDMELSEFCRKKREDGMPYDPWLRVHIRLGGKIVGYAPKSQIVEGTLREWEVWTGRRFESSGSHYVPGALQPIQIDIEKGKGIYYDQAVWISHQPKSPPQVEEKLNLTTGDDLKIYLSQTLPEYMVPLKFMFLDRLPLTPIGKIDRKALPQPGREIQRSFEKPAHQLEQQVLKIWSDILEMDPESISVTDNFFQLGGHSLKATKAVFRIRKELEVELELKDFIKEPVIRLLANRIRSLEESSYIAVEPLEEKEYYDMSYAQRRLWIIGQFEEDSTSYNMVGAFTIRGPFNPHAFDRALAELVRRHDSFKTIFVRIEGETKQRILKDFEGGLTQVDLRQVPASDREARVRSIVQQDANRAFDLEKGPLFLFKLLWLEEEQFILIVNIHHIINDGWSLGIISNEMITLYNAYLKNEESPLEPLALQYKDYSLWHNRLIEEGHLAKFENYWLEKFKDKPTGIELPLDHPRPPIQTFKGGRVYFKVSPEDTVRLNQLYPQEEATTFMKLLALLTLFMYRYTGQTDIMIGAPISGRSKPELYDIIGFLVNTLVYRNQVDPEETFLQLLRQVKQETTASYQNQDYPFDLLVEKLELDRDLSHSPLFNVMIAFDNTDIDDLDLQMEGIEFTYTVGMEEFNPSVFDLVFILDQLGGQVNGEIMYNSDLFERSTIERMAANFKTLVQDVLECREVPVSRLSYIHPNEYTAVTETFNATGHEFSQLLLQEMVEKQVAKTPGKTAVIFDSETLTYEELNRDANRLAHWLRQECAARPGQVFGICMEPSLRMIVAILGIIKSGAGYLAIDPHYPADRALHMLEDSRAPLVVVDRPRPALFEGYNGRLMQITDDRQWSQIEALPGTNPEIISQPTDIIYVIYTSGSTGTPNGAMLSQDLLCNLIQWQHTCTGIDSSLRCLQFTTISFCVSFQEIFTTLTAGGELYLIDDIQRRDVEYLMDFLARNKIQNLYLPFSYLNHLFTQSGHWGERFDHALENIITAGEQLKITSGLKEFLQKNPQVKLHNHYGSSEMHVVTSFTLDGETADNVPVPPAGKPISNTSIFILDQQYQPVPIGVWGELCIAGSSEIAGYINNKRLTGQKLLAHPQLAKPGNRLYCSGDIGRWLPDGNIELRGRKDTQIKIRGFRVELSEIESKILSLAQVKDCVVMVRETQSGDSGEATGSGVLSLVAYVVLEGIDAAQVKQHIAAYLPQYMLPRFIVLPELPLMPNGKVDREKLPQLMAESDQQERLSQPVLLATGGKQSLDGLLETVWTVLAPQVKPKDLQLAAPQIQTSEPKDREPVTLLEQLQGSDESIISKPLHRIVSDRAAQQPGTAAIVTLPDSQSPESSSNTVSYGELDRQVMQLAGYLQCRGVGDSQLVAVLLEPSIQLVVAILAIQKIGAAYLPLAPKTDSLKLEQILEKAQVSYILTHTHISRDYQFLQLRNIHPGTVKLHRTATRPQILEFDRLPIPDRSYVDYEKYGKHIGLAMVKHTLTLQATRGCPYNCAYCHKIWPKKHVIRSAENIYKELETYYRMGMRRFVFVDDIFNLDVENSRAFFQKIIDNGLDVQLMFPAGLRGDTLTEEYIDLMVKAGTINIALALETASPRLQKLIGKHLNLPRFRSIVQYLCEKYPHVVVELFTMHGFPTETEEEALMTLNFVMDMKWLHFPYINILRIYANTDMEALALQHGVTHDAIERSATLAYHELPDTLPFDKGFTFQYQTRYLNEYFLNKERLLHVLPQQMKIFTEDEIVQKYNSFLPTRIDSFDGLLQFCGLNRDQLGNDSCLPEERMRPQDIHRKMKEHFSPSPAAPGALRVLLLDLSQRFVREASMLYDGVETPLGLMYLMTYLKQQLGEQVEGRIAKSRTDFADYRQFRALVEEFQPHVIGIRTLTYFSDFFHEAASMIRQWGITAPIVAGGPYGTSDYSIILEDPNVDLVVLGEGEITFTELMQAFIRNDCKMPPPEQLESIQGIVFVKERRTTPSHPVREIILMDHIKEQLQEQDYPEGQDNLNLSRISSVQYVEDRQTNELKTQNTTHLQAAMQYREWQEEMNRHQEWQLAGTLLLGSDLDSLYPPLVQGTPLYILPPHLRPLNAQSIELHSTAGDSGDSYRFHVTITDERDRRTEDNTEPGDEVQRRLVELFAAVLELDKSQLGPASNFFDFGGHSLKATQLITRIHKEFQVNLRLMEIFKTPTVAEIAQLIRQEKQEEFSAIPPAEPKEYYPLSTAQQRLYIVQQMDEGRTIFNMPALYDIQGEVSPERFQDVFQRLIQRHESLRTSFHTVGDEPMQKIHPAEFVTFQIDTRTPLEEFIRPFDLSVAPLIRVGIQGIGEQEYRLIVDMHHIISDGTSVAILVREFMALYTGQELPPAKIHYKDYAQWQHTQLNSTDPANPYKMQEEYWSNQFSQGVPRLHLITDYPRPDVRHFEGASITFQISPEFTAHLKQLASRTGSTLYVVLLSVYTFLLSRYTNEQEIVVGTGVAGRRHNDLQDILGMFVNMLAIRNRVSIVKTFEEFLNEVKHNAISAFQNQDYPFDRLVERLGLQGDVGHNPLFDVEFTMQNVDVQEVQLPGMKFIPQPLDFGNSKFDLVLHATETGETISFILDYDTALFKPQTIEEMARHFQEIVEAIVGNSSIKLEEIDISSRLVSAHRKIEKEKIQFDF